MASIWQPFWDRADFVVVDGGLATELERRGADLRDPLWSAKVLIESPDLIRAVHADYLEAGADVITSASYQASFDGFAARDLSADQAADLMIRSVRLAQEARDRFWADPPSQRARPLVAASIGCYGACLHDGSEYRGDYRLTFDQLRDWHRPRLEVLAGSGADLLACETIPCLLEAQALAALLAENPKVPAWLSFSCRDTGHVCHGELLSDCIAAVAALENVVAVGINCTPPHLIEDLLNGLTRTKPLVVYPNMGETWDAGKQAWQAGAEPCADWEELARTWHRAGASLLGGCCRTTPDTIARLARSRRRR